MGIDSIYAELIIYITKQDQMIIMDITDSVPAR